MEDMKENLKMIKEKEKEYFIIIMVINMMVNGKKIKKKEKEYYIIIMVIKKKVYGKMIQLYLIAIYYN